MPSSHDNVSTDAAQANVLRILSGLHAGASRVLADREMILVGSGEDCDIVLADAGVARHHALINLLGDVSSMRALDAPLRVDGQPLHPGDPIELRALQRIQVGEAAIAFGAEDDPGWAALQPGLGGLGAVAERARKVGIRRMPVIVALAALSLASLAMIGAVLPAHQEKVDARAGLESMIKQFAIPDGKVAEVNGSPVLTGTVLDRATRDRIQQAMREKGIDATVDLRTGEQIAGDVGEVLRTYGLEAKTRYLGNGKVEVAGRFDDNAMQVLERASHSRAMNDVAGVTNVVPKNLANAGAGGTTQLAGGGTLPSTPASAMPPVRIVALVRGKEAHLVAVDGQQYPVGADVPGLGKLLAIGESAQVIAADGTLHRVKVEPVTKEELAEAADKQLADEAQAAAASNATATTVSPAKPAAAAKAPVPLAKGQPQPVAAGKKM